MADKKRKRNQSYTSIETDPSVIKYKLKMLEMDELSELLFNKEEEYEYLSVEKLLTFADIPTYAKFVYSTQDKVTKDAYSESKILSRIQKNILFYNNNADMIAFEKKNKIDKRFFVQTKQGNIYLPDKFYEFLGKRDPSTYPYVKGSPRFVFDEENYNVFLVRKSLDDYFACDMTNKCLKVLSRNETFSKDWKVGNDSYQRIALSTGAHGIGSECDTIFHVLRGNIFARDKMLIVCRKRKDKKSKYDMYIMFFRNPKFYQLLGLGVNVYSKMLFNENLDASVEESRTGQAKWREMLAEFDMANEDNDIITCPISGLEIIYPKEATILRASHIKEYSKCKDEYGKVIIEEAYDINNGLLVTADADALFDKHMITINPEDGLIKYSKLISKKLKEQLNFKDRIEHKYLSEERKVYLQYHWDRFNYLEERR